MVHDEAVGNLHAGVYAVEQGTGIDHRLEHRAGLSPGTHMVVLEKLMVCPTHPSEDMPGIGLHSHEPSLDDAQMVSHVLFQRHFGFLRAVVGENLDLCFFVELRFNFRIAGSLGFQFLVQRGIFHPQVHRGDIVPGRGKTLPVAVEFFLHFRQLFPDGLLGFFLHADMEGGVYLQPVGVQVVCFPVGFAQIFEQAFHFLPHELAKVGGLPLVSHDGVVVQLQGLLL